MTSFTFGTHNLHDEAGVPTFFADLVVFTEAIAPTIEALARQKLAHARAHLTGYSVVTCRQQPDLVVAYRRRLFRKTGPVSYTQYVAGRREVSPDRGTGWLPLEFSEIEQPLPIAFEHRINAAFPPYVRGEPVFRRRMWEKHTSGTLDLLDRLRDSFGIALAAGDTNTPDGVAAYSLAGSIERGEHFDRLALVHDHAHSAWSLGAPQYMSRKGSDHPRIRVTVNLKGRK